MRCGWPRAPGAGTQTPGLGPLCLLGSSLARSGLGDDGWGSVIEREPTWHLTNPAGTAGEGAAPSGGVSLDHRGSGVTGIMASQSQWSFRAPQPLNPAWCPSNPGLGPPQTHLCLTPLPLCHMRSCSSRPLFLHLPEPLGPGIPHLHTCQLVLSWPGPVGSRLVPLLPCRGKWWHFPSL